MTEDITKVHKEAILSTGLYTDFVESIPVSRILRLILGPRLIMTPLHPDLVRDRERPLYYRLGVRVENRPDPSHWLKGFFAVEVPERVGQFLEAMIPTRSTGDCRVSVQFMNAEGRLISSVSYPEFYTPGYSFEVARGREAIITLAAMSCDDNNCWVYGSGPVKHRDRLIWWGNDPLVVDPFDESRRLEQGIYPVRVVIRRGRVLLAVSYFELVNQGSVDSFRLLAARPATEMLYCALENPPKGKWGQV
jgi:hypothetical protein